MSPGQCRDRPRKAPAVAVEHRQGPQIDRMLPQAPDQYVAERVQIGAAMVIDDPLGVAGRAGGVVQRDRIPFVCGRQFGEGWVATGEKGLVIDVAEARAARTRRVDDVDDQWLALQPCQRLFDDRGEFGIGDQDLGFAVSEDEGDGFRVEADVQCVQDRTRHRHAEMGFEHFRDVRRHHRHGVATPDTRGRQSRGQPAAAVKCFAPAVPPLTMNDGETVGIDRCGAQQKADRRQRHEIGRVLVEPQFVGFGVDFGHDAPSSRSLYFCHPRCGCRAASLEAVRPGCDAAPDCPGS